MVCPICNEPTGCAHLRRSEGSVTIPTRRCREEGDVIVAENAMIGEGRLSRDALFYKSDLESQRTDQAGVTWLVLRPGASLFIRVNEPKP
jgi:hypothetical protein